MQAVKEFFDDLQAGKPYAETIVRLGLLVVIIILFVVVPKATIERGARFLLSDRIITLMGFTDRTEFEEYDGAMDSTDISDLPPTLPSARVATLVDKLSDPSGIPAGKFLYAQGDQLQFIELASGKKTIIPLVESHGRLTGFDSSPDDSTVVYSMTAVESEYSQQILSGELYLYDTQTRHTTQLTDNAKVQNRYPVFSKDGQSVYFLQRQYDEQKQVLDDGLIARLDLATKQTETVLKPTFTLTEDDLRGDRTYDDDGNWEGFSCLTNADIYSSKIGIMGIEPTNNLIQYWEPYFGPECAGLWTAEKYANADGTPALLPSNQTLFGDEYAEENEFSRLANSYFVQSDGKIIATRYGIYEENHWAVLFDPASNTISRQTVLDGSDDGNWLDFHSTHGDTISGLYALQDRENYQSYWFAQTLGSGEDLKPNLSQSLLLHADHTNDKTTKNGYHPQHVFLSERYLLTTVADSPNDERSTQNQLLLHDLQQRETVVLDSDEYHTINLEPVPVN